MVFRKFLCLGQSFGKTYLEKGKLGICWTPIILHFAVMPLLSPFFLLMSPLRPCNYLLWCHNRLPEISRRNMSIMIAFWDHNICTYTDKRRCLPGRLRGCQLTLWSAICRHWKGFDNIYVVIFIIYHNISLC